MKFGLQINQFTWPGGASRVGQTLARIGRTADEVGFDSIWVMTTSSRSAGSAPGADAEGQTALGFLAAHPGMRAWG